MRESAPRAPACVRVADRLGFALGGGEDLADRRDDEVGAGRPQALLAAEMIGDRGDVGVRRGGDLARRGRLETLRAEELERGADERGAGRFGTGRKQRLGRRPWPTLTALRRINQSID